MGSPNIFQDEKRSFIFIGNLKKTGFTKSESSKVCVFVSVSNELHPTCICRVYTLPSDKRKSRAVTLPHPPSHTTTLPHNRTGDWITHSRIRRASSFTNYVIGNGQPSISPHLWPETCTHCRPAANTAVRCTPTTSDTSCAGATPRRRSRRPHTWPPIRWSLLPCC